MYKFNKMFKFIISFLLLFSLILPNFSVNKIYAEEKIKEVENLISKNKESYDVLIKFMASTSSSDKKEMAKISQREAIELLEKGKIDGKVKEYKSFYIVNGIHAVITDANLIREIVNLKNVEKITNNGKITKIEPIKNDRREERSVIFVPDNRKIEWGVSEIHADKVWEEFNITGKGVTVGIIDTGVNYNVDAIKKNFKGYDETTKTIKDKSYYKDFVTGMDMPEADAVNDHGTHVTGTILGKEGENLNQIGVAPGAKFISARALDNNGGDTATLLSAGQWMLEQKPDIINNSWGGTNDNDIWFKDMAQAWRDAGILPVFASGNSSAVDPNAGLGSISNPGNLLNVFSVGAIDINKNIGTFSKKGPSAFDTTKKIIKPDVVAPGVQVRSVDATGKYVSWNGTSMATPHVSGVAALLKEANPKLKPEEIEKIIRETAEPLNDTTYETIPNMAYGYGMVNAYDAVASVKGRKMGSISGTVFKDGKDTRDAEIEFLTKGESYVGRDLKISVKVTDDISVKDAVLLYKSEKDSNFNELKLKLESGKQNDGIYTALIDSQNLKSGKLNLTAKVKDFAENITEVKSDIDILDGIKIPWRENFEQNSNGFIIEGNWKVTGKVGSEEPNMVDANKKYIGIDGGKSTFEKRVESFLYLPPIDLSSLSKGDKVSLSMNDYKGFTGISLAKIQVSTTGKKDDWKTLHNVELRPDITERKWEFNSYSLSDYAGEKNSVLIRLYFLGHDSDEGCGWYIDNISLNKGDTYPPYKPQGLRGEIDQKGLKISFKTVEVTDLKEYVLQRKEENGEFSDLRTFSKDERLEFVNNGKEKTYFKINYYDTTAEKGKKYIYRVKAIDVFENSSEWSNELHLTPMEYKAIVNYDFEENNGNFTKEQVKGNINDFEYGKPERPKGELDFNLNDVWSGLEPLTKMWGTNLNGVYSNEQDAYLLMPEFEVPNLETYFYFDSYTTIPSMNLTTLIVEIKDEKNEWKTLFNREEVQNPKTLRAWQTLEKNLEEYKGKKVQIRFHITSQKGIISNYELGWYLDNIFVGSKKQVFESKEDEIVEKPVHIMNGAFHNEIVGVPLEAKITILETGKYTFASEIDGLYKLGHSVNESNQPYTLRVSCYGYEPQEIKVDLSKETDIKRDFLMKRAVSTSLSGKVVDENNIALDGVNVKVVEDENVEIATTDSSGDYKISDVYTGQYTVRFYKEGFESKEVKVSLTENNFDMETVKLNSTKFLLEEKIDYGFKPKEEDGSYQTVHFNGGMKGNAVRFQAEHKGAMLKNAEIFFVNNKYYSGKDIKVAVLGYDDEGRLTELAPFKTVENINPNNWNVIDFTEYNIKRDKPLYIATRYEKSLAESVGVFYDVNSTDKAKQKSFIYDGAFLKTSILPAYGAYAIKTNWLYDKNAEKNPETNFDESSSNPDEIGFVAEREDVFEFDRTNRTILGYKGNKTNLILPKTIDNLEIKKIADKAFDGTGKAQESRLKKVIIPDGVEEIGKEAFLNNNLSEIKLPESLVKIGENAFKGQWKTDLDDKSLKVEIPSLVEVIEKGTFESSGSPLVVSGMKSVKEIKKDAFSGNKDVKITAPNLEKIEDGAFGNFNEKFNYAKIFTNNTALSSKDGEYLINPAVVKIKMVDAKDSEKIFKIGLKYGDSNPKLSRNHKANEFYKIGDKVVVSPPNLKENGVLYISNDEPVSLVLEKENIIDFRYYSQIPQIRLPLFDSDKNIVGFSIPNTEIKIKLRDFEKTVTSNEDGFFELKDVELKDVKNVAFVIKDKDAGTVSVEKWNGSDYIVKGNAILRYMGENKESLSIPNAVENSLNIEEISDFAFYGKEIKNIILPDKVKTIGAGAFLNVGLKSFSWNLQDINKSALRTIKEYAFKDNEIESVKLPELTHVIQTSVFENNKISNLELGKYTGHIGDKAFKHNLIKKVKFFGSIEEIGKESFMDNEIDSLEFLPKLEGSHNEGLTEILENTFKNNKLKEISLIDSVKSIHKTAFDGNGTEKVKVFSDNKELKSGNNFVIIRSDGSVVDFEDNLETKKDNENIDKENENLNLDLDDETVLDSKEKNNLKNTVIFSNSVDKNNIPKTSINNRIYLDLTFFVITLILIIFLKKKKLNKY